jgi:hypothetical protein
MKSRWGIVTCCIFLAIVFLIWNNAAKWVFLARVEWWAIAVLILVPLSALNALRSLFLGAYDLNDGREGFSVGFLLVAVSSSIAWTARLTEILGYARLREPMAQSFVPYRFWICALTLAVLVNFALVYYASDKTKRGKIVLGFMTGALLGAALWLVVDAVTGFFHNSFITMNPAFPLIQRIRSGLRQMPTWLWQGYLRPTNTTFDVESNHLGAFIGFVLSSSVYLWFRKRFIPPVCYLLLLLTMLVWGLSGLSFFLDTFRVPLMVPVALWLVFAALHFDADHYYPILAPGTTHPTRAAATDSEILEEPLKNQPIILVAAFKLRLGQRES